MRLEHRYLLSIAVFFFGSVLGLMVLTRKFAYLTLEHFLETCRQAVATFFSSGFHYVGLTLLLSVSLITLAFFAKTVASFIKTQRKIKELMTHRTDETFANLINVCAQLNLSNGRSVVVDKTSKHAFSFGILSPRIVISTGLINSLSQRQLEAVILHELYHLRRHHVLLLISGEIAAATLFFLPVMRDLVRRMRTSFEKEADLFATTTQGTARHLKLALAKNLADVNQYQPFPSFAEGIFTERVNSLVGRKTKPQMPKRNIFVSLMVAGLGLLLFIYPTSTHATSQPKPVDKEVSACGSNQCSPHCLTDKMAIDKA